MAKEMARPEETVEVWLSRHKGVLGRYRTSNRPGPSELLLELEGAIEELNVSQEELRAQGEEIRGATRQLEAERERYLELFDAAPDAYIITDTNGVVRAANRTASKLCGLPQARLVGKPLAVFVAEGDRGLFRTSLARLTRLEAVRDADVRFVSRQGEERVLAVRAVAVQNPGGTTEIRWMLRDVSDRLRADEALHLLRFEQAARKLAEAAEQRAAFLAEASSALLEVLSVEDTVARIAELAVPKLGAYAILDFVTEEGGLRRAAARHPDPAVESALIRRETPLDAADPASVMRVARLGRSEVVSHAEEADAAAADGYPAGMEILLPLRAHQGTLGVLTVGRGPTEHDEMNPLALGEAFAGRAAAALEHALLFDEATAARSAAETANREKVRFLSVLSHEIRTPLSSTLGYVELMLAGIPDALTDRQRTYAEGIYASVRHQLGLVDQILQFARLHSDRRGPRRADVDVAHLVLDVARVLRPAAEAQGLAIEVEGVAEPLVVHSDEGMIRQSLLNVANNAVRFTEEGGLRLSLERVDADVVLSVEDTGPGISAEDLPHVFDSFWRGPRSVDRCIHGMGLGLAITKDLVDMLGGTIAVRSTPGVGTTFTIRLPASTGAAPASAAEAEHASG